MKTLAIAGAAAALLAVVFPSGAQAPSRCDKLAGEERKLCLTQESGERERLGREEDERKPRSCDDLFGPEKEICLKRGGTVRAGAEPSAESSATGATAAPSNGASTR